MDVRSGCRLQTSGNSEDRHLGRGDRGVRRTTLCSYESLRFMLMRLVQGINKLGYEYALCSVCVPCRPVPYDEDAAVRLRKPT